jgi:hypothetical protein
MMAVVPLPRGTAAAPRTRFQVRALRIQHAFMHPIICWKTSYDSSCKLVVQW